jgi:hypothetical protein
MVEAFIQSRDKATVMRSSLTASARPRSRRLTTRASVTTVGGSYNALSSGID